MMKCFLIHGHVSQVLLLATMVPLIKNKLGDSETSDNYRSIALSSVILQIFDWIVLLLFGENLGFDDLQFSCQQNCSTTMCTWLMVESTNYEMVRMYIPALWICGKHSTLFNIVSCFKNLIRETSHPYSQDSL